MACLIFPELPVQIIHSKERIKSGSGGFRGDADVEKLVFPKGLIQLRQEIISPDIGWMFICKEETGRRTFRQERQ